MTPATGSRPTTIDGYLDALEEPALSRMRALRALVREELPEATEAIKWGAPAFLHPRGTILLVVSAHRAHANFTVTPSAKEALASELQGLETGKGSVKLPYADPLPEQVLRRLARRRLAEFEEDAVPWM
ncbi:iron chaperone [Brachybacterium sp. J153]|uniref:iron chaperone n=1 Tax=Brachybacterium sp. J153 TaxID=3116488 RepID=UPI002E7893F6|nr:DUF1801 domain-containing protein [Brachybacterium sp. J153]MEE1617271.1 DUF1801 domain-containing protein [Brachybacterium sp. J153]